MKATVTNPRLFTMLFQYVGRLIEVAHFEVKKDMLRLRGIDPHDFCYVDITLFPNFFENYSVEKEFTFSIEASKLSSILPTLNAEQILLKIEEGYVNFSVKKDWTEAFSLKWLRFDPYNLPEPNTFEYEAIASIPGRELSDLIQKASTISHEVSFSADPPNKLTVFAVKENYSFVAQLNNPYFQIDIRHPTNVSVISDYLKTLRFLIEKCETAKLFMGNEKPLRIDLIYGKKGIFSFSFSHKKEAEERKDEKQKHDRGGTSLPRVSMESFEKYLIQLSKYPEGADPTILEMAGIETKGGDHWRLSDILTLAYREKGRIKLTPLGDAFASLREKDERKARQFIHILAKDTIVPYRFMVEALETPIALSELHGRINEMLSKTDSYPIDGQDFSTLIEIAKWCDVLRSKAGLISFEETKGMSKRSRKI